MISRQEIFTLVFLVYTVLHGREYSKLRVIRIKWDVKIIRITRKFGLRGENFTGFDQFVQKICLDYAIIPIMGILPY